MSHDGNTKFYEHQLEIKEEKEVKSWVTFSIKVTQVEINDQGLRTEKTALEVMPSYKGTLKDAEKLARLFAKRVHSTVKPIEPKSFRSSFIPARVLCRICKVSMTSMFAENICDKQSCWDKMRSDSLK